MGSPEAVSALKPVEEKLAVIPKKTIIPVLAASVENYAKKFLTGIISTLNTTVQMESGQILYAQLFTSCKGKTGSFKLSSMDYGIQFYSKKPIGPKPLSNPEETWGIALEDGCECRIPFLGKEWFLLKTGNPAKPSVVLADEIKVQDLKEGNELNHGGIKLKIKRADKEGLTVDVFRNKKFYVTKRIPAHNYSLTALNGRKYLIHYFGHIDGKPKAGLFESELVLQNKGPFLEKNSGEWDAEVIYHKGKLFSIVISATRKFKTKTIKDNTLFKFPNYPKTGAVRYKGEKKFEIINRNL